AAISNVLKWPLGSANLHYLLSSVIWLIAAVGIVWLMFIYQQRKSGAFLLGAAIVLVVTAAFFYSMNIVPGSIPGPILKAAMLCTEVTFTTLCGCWILFGLSCIAARIQGWRAVRAAAQRGQARQVVWTVHLTLILPALLSAVVNISLWAGIFVLSKPFI